MFYLRVSWNACFNHLLQNELCGILQNYHRNPKYLSDDKNFSIDHVHLLEIGISIIKRNMSMRTPPAYNMFSLLFATVRICHLCCTRRWNCFWDVSREIFHLISSFLFLKKIFFYSCIYLYLWVREQGKWKIMCTSKRKSASFCGRESDLKKKGKNNTGGKHNDIWWKLEEGYWCLAWFYLKLVVGGRCS